MQGVPGEKLQYTRKPGRWYRNRAAGTVPHRPTRRAGPAAPRCGTLRYVRRGWNGRIACPLWNAARPLGVSGPPGSFRSPRGPDDRQDGRPHRLRQARPRRNDSPQSRLYGRFGARFGDVFGRIVTPRTRKCRIGSYFRNSPRAGRRHSRPSTSWLSLPRCWSGRPRSAVIGHPDVIRCQCRYGLIQHRTGLRAA